MYQDRYHLYLTGNVLPGTKLEDAANSMAKIFNADESKTIKFLDGKTRSVAKISDIKKLKELESKLINIGVICKIGLIFDSECFKHALVDAANQDSTAAEQEWNIKFPSYWLKPKLFSPKMNIQAVNTNNKMNFDIRNQKHKFNWGVLFLVFAAISVALVNNLLAYISIAIDNLLISRLIGVLLFFMVWISGALLSQSRSKLLITDLSSKSKVLLQQKNRLIFPNKLFELKGKSLSPSSIQYSYIHQECILYDNNGEPVYRANLDVQTDTLLLNHLNNLKDQMENIPLIGSLVGKLGSQKFRNIFLIYDGESNHVATIKSNKKETYIQLFDQQKCSAKLFAMVLVLGGA